MIGVDQNLFVLQSEKPVIIVIIVRQRKEKSVDVCILHVCVHVLVRNGE